MMGSLELPTRFSIPQDFTEEIGYAPVADTRSDAEIIASLSKVSPVVSERNVWAFWDRGLTNMPGWCQRNVVNWVRLLGPSWTVRVVDDVPDSPHYALKYIPAKMLPEAYVNGTMEGPHIAAIVSDFVRSSLLILYGGIYMDVGIVLIRHLDRICWDAIMDPKSPYNICVGVAVKAAAYNFFIAARKDDPFLKAWYKLHKHLWEGRTNYEGLMDHPLFDYARAFLKGSALRLGDKDLDWSKGSTTKNVFEYGANIVSWTRVCKVEDDGDGFNPAAYWEQHVMVLDAMEEFFAAETLVGFNGQDAFDLLALPLDSDPESEEYKQASRLVWRILARSSVQKVYHAGGMLKNPSLGTLWDRPENSTKDCTPGTFAELLRFGALNFRQTRSSPLLREAEPQVRLGKGLLEP